MNIHGRALVGFISNRDPPQRSRFVMAPFTPTLWHESRLDAQHGGVPRRFSRQHMLCQICIKGRCCPNCGVGVILQIPFSKFAGVQWQIYLPLWLEAGRLLQLEKAQRKP